MGSSHLEIPTITFTTNLPSCQAMVCQAVITSLAMPCFIVENKASIENRAQDLPTAKTRRTDAKISFH